MLSLQEISDRLEIQQLMVDYSTAIDTKNFDGLDLVFTPDAYIDYRVFGGIDGRFPEIKAWLTETLKRFPIYYHMIGNVDIKITGDTATSKITCFNPMVVAMPEGGTQVMYCGLWYHDKHVRTAEGWRIAERVEQATYVDNVPPHIKATPD
jgi:hypothetical protein